MDAKKISVGLFALEVVVLALCGCFDKRPVLQVYSWSDYIDPEIVERFESEYGCVVSITTFDSNEAAYAKLKAGGNGYDVMFPSSYMIGVLAKEGIIEKLDHERLQTVQTNFCHRFDKQIHDVNLSYGVPYLATYTGLMYDKERVKFDGDVSWCVLADMKSGVSLLDDMREVIGIGLMVNGYSLNSEDPDEIEKAGETIVSWKKNIRKFDAESYKTEIANKSLALGHGYSSDAFQVIIGESEDMARKDIGFVLPKEGFTIAFDEMVVFNDSKQKDLAYEFIDFMYRSDVACANMVYNFSPSPNNGGLDMLPKEYREIILLDDKTISRGQVMRGFKSAETMNYYNRAWDKIRALR